MITQLELKELLRYDRKTGNFFWRTKLNSRMKIGSKAGCFNCHGYWHIRIHGKLYMAHRLAWLYITGNWPKEQIDHIDGNKANNVWNNLREVNLSQNRMNVSIYRNNSTGYTGVRFNKKNKKFTSHISVNKKEEYLGSFPTLEEAVQVRKEAEKKYYGEYSYEESQKTSRKGLKNNV